MQGFCEICPHVDEGGACHYPERRPGATEDITVTHRTLPQQKLLSTIAGQDQIAHVKEGWAYSFRLAENGRRSVGGIYSEGDLLSTVSFFSSGLEQSVRALSDLKLCVMDVSEFLTLVRQRDDYFAYFQKMSLRLFWILSNCCFDLSNRSTEERLCRSLVVACLKLYGEVRPTTEPVPLTQEVLADKIGTSKVHVNRLLVNLQREGVCHVRHGYMTIQDGRKLLEKAGVSASELETWKKVLGVGEYRPKVECK